MAVTAGRARTGEAAAPDGPEQDTARPPGSVLYVTTSLDIGGTERHLALVAGRLRRRGRSVAICCLERPGQLAAEVEAAGVEVVRPPVPTRPGEPRLARAAKRALAALKLLALLSRRRPAVVHFFLPGPYLIGAPLAILARCRVRVMSRRSLNVYQRGRPFAARLERALHRRMSAVLANSREVLRQLTEEEGVPPARAGLIHNGIDIDAIAGAAASAAAATGDRAGPDAGGEAGGPLRLIVVANLIPYKGHADLLRALASVDRSLPAWTLVCVGRDDGIGASLRDLSGRLGIEAKVAFAGERRDVAVLLKAADIGILCSHEEGFSNAVVEGSAAGLPMIVTDVGGNAEAVEHGRTGLVVPARDPEALGRAIVALAGDAEARARMGAAGAARARALFDIAICARRYERLYEALLESGGRADVAAAIECADRRPASR